MLITKISNGIIFDTTGLPGSGVKFAKKKFIPSNFPNVDDILLYDDRVVANSASRISYSLNLTGADGAYPVTQIDGTPIESLEQLFNVLISLM
jgi:hypothetical protein